MRPSRPNPRLAPAMAAVFVLLLPALLGAQPAAASPAAPASSPALLPFRAEGSSYVATGSSLGATEAEALEAARGAALRALFAGLRKDRLFAEVFVRDPPLGLAFETLSLERTGQGGWTAAVSLKVDDESLRIVARGPFLAAALSLLDGAEAEAAKADELLAAGAEAEARALLGEALGRYGQALDRLDAALALVEPLEDGSVLSTAKGRSSPELKRALLASREGAQKGVARIRAAESALALDEADAAAAALVEAALEAVRRAESLLEEEGPVLAEPSAYGPERLEPLRDRLLLERRALADAGAALDRALPAVPADKAYLRDKFDFAGRRLATLDASLLAAFRGVDRELRDPAARRAARARLWRWVFLHEPREHLALRLLPPPGLELEEGEASLAEGSPFDFRLRSEDAFSFGSGGVWLRAGLESGEALLSVPEGQEGLERFLSSSFDFGVWGRKGLWYAGYGWDWGRSLDGGASTPGQGRIRAGLGGVSSNGDANRADWLLGLSYELPLQTEGLVLANVLNAGVEGQFRLGSLALLEFGAAHRVRREPSAPSGLDGLLSWSLAFALRLPKPFAWGLEYSGSRAASLGESGSYEGEARLEQGLRFFLEYAL